MKSCLVVVDYQTRFVTGVDGFPAAREIEQAIAGRILEYRQNGGDVIFLCDEAARVTKSPDPTNLYGAVGELRRQEDAVIWKGSFGAGLLYRLLSDVQYAAIELAGLTSYICLLANAVLAQAAQPETPIIIDLSCTAGPDHELHAAGIAVMRALKMQVIER